MTGPDSIAVVGVPLDENSSFLAGAAQAPGRIREALRSPSTNLGTEGGVDLETHPGWEDMGDLDPGAGAGSLGLIERGVADLLASGRRVVALGGDHSVTYPIVRAHAGRHPGLTVLHLDAHPDLYHEFEGSRESHACPFARIMEEGLVRRLVQVGIRTMNPHQREQAERFEVEVVGMRDFAGIGARALGAPLYLSVDLDVLDPAFASGVSHPEPGGFTTRELIGIIQDLPGPLAGADIVEYNPRRDPQGLTAMVAAKVLKEILGRMLAAGTR